MHTTQSPSESPNLHGVYFTPPGVIEALQAIGPNVIAVETPQPHDFVLGNPPFGSEQSGNA